MSSVKDVSWKTDVDMQSWFDGLLVRPMTHKILMTECQKRNSEQTERKASVYHRLLNQ